LLHNYKRASTPCYVVVWDLHCHILECERLEPAADLSGAMTATFERLKAKGWQAEGDATYGFVFVRRSGERRLLAISIHKFLPTPIVSVASAAALMNLHVRNVATSSGTVWHGDEHPGLVDLAGLQVKPLDRITRVIDLHAFAGGELTSGDARLAILRELAVELFPEVRVRCWARSSHRNFSG
jgi:hypothetical protein